MSLLDINPDAVADVDRCEFCEHHREESKGLGDSWHRCHHPVAVKNLPPTPFRTGGWCIALYGYHQKFEPYHPHWCPFNNN